jgi:hypothetical protein
LCLGVGQQLQLGLGFETAKKRHKLLLLLNKGRPKKKSDAPTGTYLLFFEIF